MKIGIRHPIVRMILALSLSVIFSACGGSPQGNSSTLLEVTAPPDIVAEAAGPNGSIVIFAVSVSSASSASVSGTPTITCIPASGTIFQIGETPVTCTATNSAGTSSVNFKVIVRDTTPPVLSVPPNIIAGTSIVNFTTSASDLVSGSLTPSCNPSSGSIFALGTTTTVNCSATDDANNVTSTSFTVKYAVRGTANPMDAYIYNNMATGEWRLWTTGTDGGFGSAILPRTRANFDGNGTGINGTWLSDAAVSSAIKNAEGVWAFSSPAINPYNGDVCIRGGGHSDGGDGGIYCLNLLTGPNVNWSLKVPSARHISAAEPKPTWSHQQNPSVFGTVAATGTNSTTSIVIGTPSQQPINNASTFRYYDTGGAILLGTTGSISGSTVTLSNSLLSNLNGTLINYTDGYWAVTNKNSVRMPMANHTYFANSFGPNSDVLYLSGHSGWDTNGHSNMGDAYAYKPSLSTNDGMLGPFYIAPAASPNTPPYNSDSWKGYSQNSNTLVGLICGNDLDGKMYTYGTDLGTNNSVLWRIENALTAPSLTAIMGRMAHVDIAGDKTNCVIFPDPVNGSSNRSFFAQAGNRYILMNDINGTPSYNNLTWVNGFPATASSSLVFTWNSDLNVMAMTDGIDIWEFSFDTYGVASGFTKITASATGEKPTTAPVGSGFQRLSYFSAPYYSYAMCKYKQCSVFRRQ